MSKGMDAGIIDPSYRGIIVNTSSLDGLMDERHGSIAVTGISGAGKNSVVQNLVVDYRLAKASSGEGYRALAEMFDEDQKDRMDQFVENFANETNEGRVRDDNLARKYFSNLSNPQLIEDAHCYAISRGGFFAPQLVKRSKGPLSNIPRGARGWVLDGHLRMSDQVEGIQDILKEVNAPLKGVVLVHLDAEIALSRLLNRLVCGDCKASYSTLPQDPTYHPKDIFESDGRLMGYCADDSCGSLLTIREDDKDPIKNRRRVAQWEKYAPELLRQIQNADIPIIVLPGSPMGTTPSKIFEYAKATPTKLTDYWRTLETNSLPSK